jgi:DNA-binding GntR family transcriptional regulator
MSSTPDALSRLDRSSTAAKAADFLRARIADGTLKPGQRISELALSATLGISRSPIREALGQMALEGLVESVPYKGSFVKALDADRLRNLVELRVALEEFAVRRVVARATDENLDGLAHLIDAVAQRAKAGNFDGTVEADLRVHEYLVGLVGNPLLTQTYAAMLNELRLYIRVTSRHYARIDELATEHAAMLDAVRKRRRAEAARLLSEHIMHGLDDALKEIQTV